MWSAGSDKRANPATRHLRVFNRVVPGVIEHWRANS
jgi:hypothetical protein